MTNEAFLAVLEARISSMRSVLASKAKEYATVADRLHNFKRAASIIRESPAHALLGMLAKHLVSVVDMVEDAELASVAMIDEKIGDSINYLVLLEAILKETV